VNDAHRPSLGGGEVLPQLHDARGEVVHLPRERSGALLLLGE
jgi:hypothetical protein